MSKRAKIFLIFFNVLIIFIASWNIRSWQKDQEIKRVKAWANRNFVTLKYDFPEWMKSSPKFLQTHFKNVFHKKLVGVRYDIFNDEQMLRYKGLGGLKISDDNSDHVIDMTPLSNIESIEFIYFTGVKIKNLSIIEKFSNLKSFSIAAGRVEKIPFSPRNKNLESVFLLGTTIKDISSFRYLKNLKGLQIMNTSITDLGSLKGLTNLEELHITGSPVRDLSSLKTLSNLKRLSLEVDAVVGSDFKRQLEKALPNCEISITTLAKQKLQ